MTYFQADRFELDWAIVEWLYVPQLWEQMGWMLTIVI